MALWKCACPGSCSISIRRPRAEVHADYYQHYGVEPLRIESIYLGVGLGETAEEISMSAYKLETWQQPTYRERLKAAYWMLQESWGGGDAD